MIAQNIGFWIIAVLMVVSALRVVTTNNVVHAALWLVVVLAGAASTGLAEKPNKRLIKSIISIS